MTRHAMEAVTGPATLADIQRTLDLAWSDQELSDYTKMCVELAVSEIATNIIQYSGDGQPVRLRMVVDLQPDTITVAFTDNGHAAPVDLAGITMSDEAAEGGRGLALAFRVLDELTYFRDRDGNHWTLKRRRPE